MKERVEMEGEDAPRRGSLILRRRAGGDGGA